jgi:hypothetical protein
MIDGRTHPTEPGSIREAAPGVSIALRCNTSAHRRVATLLAIIAEVPKTAGSPQMERRINSICRAYWHVVSERDPEWRQQQATLLPKELEPLVAAAEKTLEDTLAAFNKGLTCAHVLIPYFRRAMARADHAVGKPAASAVKSPPPELKSSIERLLWQEDIYRESIEEKFGQEVAPRLPASDTAGAVKNITNRHLRQFRPVWHLLVACAVEIDRMEKALASLPRQAAVGMGFPEDTAFRFTWFHLTLYPEWIDRMIQTAQEFERAVPFLELKHAPEHELVRLRLS